MLLRFIGEIIMLPKIPKELVFEISEVFHGDCCWINGKKKIKGSLAINANEDVIFRKRSMGWFSDKYRYLYSFHKKNIVSVSVFDAKTIDITVDEDGIFKNYRYIFSRDDAAKCKKILVAKIEILDEESSERVFNKYFV